MKVLVTGGAGFVGQYLARRLVGAGHQVAALDLLRPQVHADPGAAVSSFPGDVVVGDVADEATWVSLPAPHVVVHLAAETGASRTLDGQDRAHRVNVGGTSLAGRFAAQWGVPLVALSSRSVYGHGRHHCEDHGLGADEPCCPKAVPLASSEDDPHRPVCVEGETRSLGERRLAHPARAVPITVVRPQNVIGPGQSVPRGVLATWLTALRAGEPLRVHGDGGRTRDLVHVDDVARLVAWAVEHPAPVGEPRVVNAGTGVRTTLLELARLALAARPASYAPVPVEVTHAEVRHDGDVDHACADLARLRALGAPAPSWTTADAVADQVRAAWAGAPVRT